MKIRKCSAIGCTRAIPARFLMCSKHWQMVPLHIQKQIWKNFKPNQTIQTVSAEYLTWMKQAVDYVAECELKVGRLDLSDVPWGERQ